MEPQIPFENYARPRPFRTYSHKARTSSPTVLPLLRTREPPASLARKHQQSPAPQDEDFQDEDSQDYGVVPEEETAAYQAGYDFEDAHEVELEPQYASDTSQSPADYATEDDASLEYSTDEDEDKRTTPEESKSTPPSSVKSSSSTKYLSKSVTDQSNRLRRRPFLLFDKLPPRGFKRLKPKIEDNITATLSAKYKLGDGFSKDEAKPNGLVQLGFHPMVKRRAPQVESKVGALDLTQSSFTRSPKKDSIVNKKNKTTTKKRAYDNSFLPDPKHAERQRKRQKQLKKKDNPLNDKEMLPPTAAVKPKMILTSAILGEYAHFAEKPQPSAAAVTPEHEQTQTRIEAQSRREEEEADVPSDDNEEGDLEFEEPISREPSVELGEPPARKKVPGHSPFNHQQDDQQQEATLKAQQEEAVEVLSEDSVQSPVQEPAVQELAVQELAIIEPVEKSLEQPAEESPKGLEQPVGNPLDGPVKKPAEEQVQSANHIEIWDGPPSPVTIKESTSVKFKSKSSFNSNSEPTERGTENLNAIDTAELPKATSHDSLGAPHYRQTQRQRSNHQEETSPGSGWETYISETDIHTPTPPRPLNSRAKSVPSVPSTSSRPGNTGLRRSNSAV
ncbi:hypothetical protein SMACR_04767 [Sordaria macrospora]|uniref:WGS project CABT00000000 data, contig 2.21 n=2 Tax=Sordaria macrospora TaxID=5147 RepID=F7W2D5_SORMK|nr:uncharacterized protein SMAC_04767 [Sordaria macrospora k-hell]KAA8636716.1 hypothetical protein SMACR_04767 [Sordaria macrospora]WPJ62040.1 hypothetical protein SMAC4_04767 [Sordaria macrospora]CCC11785.1 unnamed protein product [Sordaria macrospora k-hell]